MKRICKKYGLIGLALVAMGCAQPGGGGGPGALSLGFNDSRPEGRRYVDYLLQDGGLAEIQSDIASRSASSNQGIPLSFLGKRRLDPYNAPMLPGANITKRLRQLTACMIEAWTGPKPDVNVIVNSGLSPSGEALPNEIAINIGLLAAKDITAGEVAYVLAHELAHVFLDHYERAEFLETQAKVAKKAAQVAIIAAYASETRARRNGNKIEFFVEDEGDVAEATIMAIAAHEASQLVADGLIESSWSRSQEFEADRLAVDILQNSGVSDQFSYQALRRIATFEQGRKSRLQKLEAVANAKMQAALDSGDVNLVARTGAEVFTQAASSAARDVYDLIDRSHPSPEAREGELDDYFEEFEDQNASEIVADCNLRNLERALADRRLKSAAKAIASANSVSDFLAVNDISGARAAAKNGLKAGLDRHPVTRLAAYKVDAYRGRNDLALQHLKKIRQSATTPLAVYSRIASEYIVRNQFGNASKTLDRADQYYLADFYFPQRLQIAVAREDVAAIAAYKARCDVSKLEGIRDACDEVLSARKEALSDSNEEGVTGAFGDLLTSFKKLGS